MEAHGGYLCRFEDVDVAWLVQVARRALEEDGYPADDVSLQISVLSGPGLVRFSWSAPFAHGRAGARWYLSHHALARCLSEHLKTALHVYVFDPDELELVLAYGNGRKVGGEVLRYVDVELPDDEDDAETFERLRAKWPLGHLARVLGVSRDELIRLSGQPAALVALDRPWAPQPMWQLFPEALRRGRPAPLARAG
ncbi:MAG: hypothetical protein INH41_16290 [Myxococcaceae bacterium]|nr:hypothetical protein [Myxococcaceae bacterium]